MPLVRGMTFAVRVLMDGSSAQGCPGVGGCGGSGGVCHLFEGVGGCGGSAGCVEGGGDALRAGSEVHGVLDGDAQPCGIEPARGESDAGVSDFDAAGDLRLVASEGDGDDGHAVGERLLGDAHAGVADDAGGAVEHR